MADRDRLYKAWLAAIEKADEMALAEAKAKLKAIETRVAATRAEKAYDAAFAAHHSALDASRQAHLDWQDAKEAGL